MAKSQFFRVATEGATTDGRAIEAQWIKDMAETYDPKTRAARLFCEHIKGVSPDGPFGAYGDVLALKAEPVQLSVGGKTETRLALYAQIDALDPLVELNRKGQKLYSSIEVAPNFAGSGKAYLDSIAITDNPASLGTEMLKFCAGQGDANPLAHRKSNKANLFSAAEAIALDFADVETPTGDGSVSGLLETLKGLFNFSQQTAPTTPAPAAPVAPAPAAPPVQGPSGDGVAFGAAATALLTFAQNSERAMAAIADRQEKTEATLAELRSALERAPLHGFNSRTPATGAEDDTLRAQF